MWKGSSNIKMCNRWHSKGNCFDDCKNRESHVSADEVSEKDKNNYAKYLKKIQGE
jgi:hypothetical protein